MFALGKPIRSANLAKPAFLRPDGLMFANASSAFFFLVKHHRPRRIWLPSYLCPSLVAVARHAGGRCRFYSVNGSLAPSPTWIDGVKPGDLVVIIDYFGFVTATELAVRAREQGALIVEDAAQALLSKASGSLGDYTIFSPRKFLGVPDGGILISRSGSMPRTHSLTNVPTMWFAKALRASMLRRDFDAGLYDGAWYEMFKDVEATVPIGYYAISPLSASLLKSAFDYRQISARRRANYRFLGDWLRSIAILPHLSKGVSPLGFPVRVPDRERVLRVLYSKRIYPPVHWRLNDHVPRRFLHSHSLSTEIMTIPCDQRYDRTDLTRVIEVLRSALPDAIQSGSRRRFPSKGLR